MWRNVLALALLLGAASVARAQDSPAPGELSDPAELLSSPHAHVELTLGYGTAIKFVKASSVRQFAVVSPRFGVFLTEPLDRGGTFEGSPELLFQWNYLQQLSPGKRYLAGGSLLLRYNLFTTRRVIPFVDGGAGIQMNDLGRPEEGGHFGFQLQLAIGAHVRVTDAWAITAEVRYHHASNAGIYDPNEGVNSVLFLVGCSFFF